MRPARLQQLLLDAAAPIPDVSARSFADAGHSRHPYGIVVEAAGRTSRWQVVSVHPGDNYQESERLPTLGEHLPEREVPTVTSDLATVEAALVAAVLRANPGEFSAVRCYSQQETVPAVGHGAAFDLYSGAKVYIQAI